MLQLGRFNENNYRVKNQADRSALMEHQSLDYTATSLPSSEVSLGMVS